MFKRQKLNNNPAKDIDHVAGVKDVSNESAAIVAGGRYSFYSYGFPTMYMPIGGLSIGRGILPLQYNARNEYNYLFQRTSFTPNIIYDAIGSSDLGTYTNIGLRPMWDSLNSTLNLTDQVILAGNRVLF